MSSSLLQEIRKLSLAERLQLVEDVWDSIAMDAEEFPIPDSHREELARRRAEHRRSPEDVVPRGRMCASSSGPRSEPADDLPSRRTG